MKSSKNKKKWIFFSVFALITALSFVVFAIPRSSSPYHKLAIFARVLTNIERYYVKNVDGEQLIEGAIKGMLRTLDPHSAYLSKDKFRIFNEDTIGNFGGVGMEVGIKNNVMTVITPIHGSPAEAAGIKPGDQVIKIEGKPTANMTIDESVMIMRGKIGVEVTLTIRRDGTLSPFDVTMIRENIRMESVTSKYLEPGFLWIKLRVFQDNTFDDIRKILIDNTPGNEELKGLLLDMRRNPGGLLEEAIKVSDLFINSGLLLTTRGRDETQTQRYKAHRLGTISDIPIVVLIDGATASAAEIVAGAIQDHGRGLLVGMKSFGKGSVQSIIPLGMGSGLKLTTALYFTPSGKSIQAAGIEPDVEIKSKNAPLPDEETKLLQQWPDEKDLPGHLSAVNLPDEKKDNHIIDDYQLRIAFQILKGTAQIKDSKKHN